MDTQVILDELDNMIARAEHEKAIHRFRIDAMPRCPARESDERGFTKWICSCTGSFVSEAV